MRLIAYALLPLLLAACDSLPPVESRHGGGLSEKEQNLFSIAASTRAAGNLDGAAELYRQMAVGSTGSVVAHLELASIYRQQKKPEMAVEVLRSGQALQPQDEKLLTALGAALIAAGQPKEALSVFDEALAANAQSAGALNGRGAALDALGEHAQAQTSYRKALRADGGNVAVLNNLALSLILTDHYDDAIAILEKLNTGETASPTLRQNLALAYGLKGNRKKAMELGLKDLSTEEAAENLKFYDYYQQLKKTGEPAQQAVPVAPVSLRHAKAKAAPVVAVEVEQDEEAPADAEVEMPEADASTEQEESGEAPTEPEEAPEAPVEKP